MATTAIGNDRQADIAVQIYTDAMFIRDNKKFYLGTDGDFSMEYDADGNGVALCAGADLRMADGQKIGFGADADLTFDSSDGYLFLRASGNALSDVDPARAGALYTFSDESSAKNLALSSGS